MTTLIGGLISSQLSANNELRADVASRTELLVRFFLLELSDSLKWYAAAGWSGSGSGDCGAVSAIATTALMISPP